MQENWKKDEISEPEQIELHNPEMTDILGEPPSWLLRGGSYLFLGIIGILLAGLFYFDYPRVTKYPLVIQDTKGVEWITSPYNGILDSLCVADGDTIVPGMRIGHILNQTNAYELKSTHSGILNMGPTWAINRNLQIGDTICAIVSHENRQLEGHLLIPSKQSIKFNHKDSILIELDRYPSREYGYIAGCIKQIVFVPSKHCLAVTVSLSFPMKTTSGVTIDYSIEQTGTALFSEKRKFKILK